MQLGKSSTFPLIPATDILGRRNEIKDCIAAANMADAVRRLIDFTRDFQPAQEDEAVMISMDYYELVSDMQTYESRCKNGQSDDCEVQKKSLMLAKKHLALRIFSTLNNTLQNIAQA